MAILNNSNAISSGGYDINNSLRFRASASAYLSRTPASAGTQTTWTWSGWVKRSIFGSQQKILTAGSTGSLFASFEFIAGDNFQFYAYNGATNAYLVTTQVFRDPSAWYHIVFAVDTTQATDSNRIKIYVNGTQVTAFSTSTYPSQNFTFPINNNVIHNIGRDNINAGDYFDGYLADVNFIDGSQKAASDFGETDTTTGSWKPKAYTGTYGTNGFYLKFSDIATTSGSNAGLGKDFSGNTNYWTTNNISVTAGTTYDAMIDSPTLTSETVANYAALNPLVGSVGVTLSQANLSATFDTAGGTRYGTIGTIGVSSGKWYWEYEFSAGGNSALVGITQKPFAVQMGTYPGFASGDYGYFGSNGSKYTNDTGSAYGATFTTGDVIGIALDLDAGTLTFYKNNTSQGTAYSSISGTFFPAIGKGITATGITSFVNFGQRPFTYTPPTGFVRLNTYNLPDSTIKKGNTVMDATLYSGTSATQTIVNAGAFKPDFLWLKNRGSVSSHQAINSVAAGFKSYPNLTDAQDSATDFTSFNSNGFTLTGAQNNSNLTGQTYVGWQWQAGQGTNTSNTSGTITSTVSVNATAGFSVVTYTGTGSAATIGHGLGVAPKMIIVKNRDATDAWQVYHAANTANPETDYLVLNTTAATADAADRWNDTLPTSTVFSIGNGVEVNTNTEKYVAYCWAAIPGYSAFGSYTGNGSADGPFVYTGFRPKFVMIKGSSASGNPWYIVDSSRNTYNIAGQLLEANSSAAESTYDFIDFLSNGFKIRNTGSGINGSGATFIVAAFAENPFKNSNAR